MITEINTISVGGAGNAVVHYFMKSNAGLSPDDPDWKKKNNDEIVLRHGDSRDLKAWEKHVQAKGRKVAILDIEMMPNGDLTPEQWDRAEEIADMVMGVGDHESAMVLHDKPRGDESKFKHGHKLCNMINPFSGRSANTQDIGLKAQVISRLCEYEFGLDPTPGKYDEKVVEWLQDRGMENAAADISHNLEQARALKAEMAERNKPSPNAKPLAPATYKNSHLRHAEKNGVDLPKVWNQLRATNNDPTAVADALVDLEGQGFNIVKGDKGNIVLIEKENWRKSLGRLAGLDDDADFYSKFIEAKEKENGRAEARDLGRDRDPDLEFGAGRADAGHGLPGATADAGGYGAGGEDAPAPTPSGWDAGGEADDAGYSRGEDWFYEPFSELDYADAGLAAEGFGEFDQTGHDVDPGHRDPAGGWGEPDYGAAGRGRSDLDGPDAGGPGQPRPDRDAPENDRADPADVRARGRDEREIPLERFEEPVGYGQDDPADQGLSLTDEIEAAQAAEESRGWFQRLRDSLAAFITPADKLEANLAAKAAQPEFDQLREMRQSHITPADELEANLAAQAAQAEFDKLREARMAFITSADELEANMAAQAAQAEFDQLREAREQFEKDKEINHERADRAEHQADVRDDPTGPSYDSGSVPEPVGTDPGIGGEPGDIVEPAIDNDPGAQQDSPVHAEPSGGGGAGPRPVRTGGGGGGSAGVDNSDIEPIPDSNDPNLLKKLSAILAKQMAKNNAAMKAQQQAHKSAGAKPTKLNFGTPEWVRERNERKERKRQEQQAALLREAQERQRLEEQQRQAEEQKQAEEKDNKADAAKAKLAEEAKDNLSPGRPGSKKRETLKEKLEREEREQARKPGHDKDKPDHDGPDHDDTPAPAPKM